LPEFGCHGRIVSQNNECPGPEVHDLGSRRECRGSRFSQQLLQIAQAARAAGKRREVA